MRHQFVWRSPCNSLAPGPANIERRKRVSKTRQRSALSVEDPKSEANRAYRGELERDGLVWLELAAKMYLPAKGFVC